MSEIDERQDFYQRVRRLEGPALATEVMGLIHENLDRWNQGDWRYNGEPAERYDEFREDPLNPQCKTSFCFAGWVAAIDGVKWAKQHHIVVLECTCTTSRCQYPERHNGVAVGSYADRRLGLTPGEGDRLFDGANTLDDLEQMVDAMADGNSVHDTVLDREQGSDYYDDDDEEEEMADA